MESPSPVSAASIASPFPFLRLALILAHPPTPRSRAVAGLPAGGAFGHMTAKERAGDVRAVRGNRLIS
ncbi:hypothetical protein GCM10017673_00260 [Streptosporangium violaceochromogenes]|nr:hypothetical protein GCM10017673_00260 [Streptosporangium violaceochromogenes]